MAKINTAHTICYFATDTTDGSGKTGDSANHTLKVVADGTVGSVAASPAEVDSTNIPGLYKVVVASGENTGEMMILAGKSSTANIAISPVQWTNVCNVVQVSGVAEDIATETKQDTIDANVDAILADTNELQTDNVPGLLSALESHGDSTWATATGFNTTAPDNAGIAAIKAKTDSLTFTGSDINATLDGEAVTVSNVNDCKADVSGLATASALATVDTVVDAILVDTGTTIPAQIGALNDFNPAVDTVARVTLVDTCTTNSDMISDYATTAALSAVGTIVNNIFADTSLDIPALINGLNDFDPANDTVANVALVDVCTTNTDMRGTDSALLAADYTAAPTVGDIADAVWDEDTSGHNAAGSFGESVNGIESDAAIIVDYWESDAVYDDSTTPHKMILKRKDTSTVIMTKYLYDVNGVAKSDIVTMTGMQLETEL